jgi:uncharacterized membrane protein YeaQ/YmgE (transglycosylase-associated protein family)
MTPQLLMMWVLVGLSAGSLARYVMKEGSYGLIGDLALGLVGSMVAGFLVWFLGNSPGAIPIAWVVVVSAGAVLAIVAQRMCRQGHA